MCRLHDTEGYVYEIEWDNKGIQLYYVMHIKLQYRNNVHLLHMHSR